MVRLLKARSRGDVVVLKDRVGLEMEAACKDQCAGVRSPFWRTVIQSAGPLSGAGVQGHRHCRQRRGSQPLLEWPRPRQPLKEHRVVGEQQHEDGHRGEAQQQ